MSAVAIESGFWPIGGSTKVSWSPTDAGNSDASITGATITYKVFASDQWDAEKATPGSGTTVLSGTLTESPSGTYTDTLAIPTSFVDGAAYVIEVSLTASGLTAIRQGAALARYPNSSGS